MLTFINNQIYRIKKIKLLINLKIKLNKRSCHCVKKNNYPQINYKSIWIYKIKQFQCKIRLSYLNEI